MKEEIPPRRVVLRGALAAACGLLLPAVLSRAGTTAASSAPASAAKVSKASARYQAKPKGAQQCGTCANFIPESNTCKLVEGNVAPQGWCSLWAKKA